MGRGLTTHEESNRRDKLSLMKPRLLARHAEGMGIDESLIDEADASMDRKGSLIDLILRVRLLPEQASSGPKTLQESRALLRQPQGTVPFLTKKSERTQVTCACVGK